MGALRSDVIRRLFQEFELGYQKEWDANKDKVKGASGTLEMERAKKAQHQQSNRIYKGKQLKYRQFRKFELFSAKIT